MSMILLLDLDDTCLGNSMETFLPVYLQALGEHFADIISPEELLPALLSATQEMLEYQRPDRTLKQVFDQAFYPKLDLDPEILTDLFESFYSEVFPGLKSLTQYRPEAVSMVEEAFRRGYTIAIASNPLFPLTVILQRLEWAGLSPQRYPFSLIPSYETSYFAKPNPSFFAEILSLLGWPEGPIVMVGDNTNHDINPARKFGIGTFWITNGTQSEEGEFDDSAGYGNIEDLLPWIDSTPSDRFQPQFNHIEAMLAVLRASPAALSAFARDLEALHWQENPQPGEWSFTEIICHLRDVDTEVNTPRVDQVLNEHNPFLPGIDSDKWANERLYYCQNGPQALHDFTNSRLHLLEILDGMQAEDWQRPARHAIFGPTNLKELVSIIVGHDRLHVQQAMKSLVLFSTHVLGTARSFDLGTSVID
jgi:FMN phosphatase YigB (HAD superfamily)